MYRFPRFVLRLAARLPLSLLHRLGSVLGWAVYGISPTYRRHLRENLAQAGYTQARVRREAIASAGRMVAELPALWFRPAESVVALVKEVEGLEAALAAHAQGRPVVFLTPHMGCFEVAAQYAASRMPITVLYRPPKIGWLEPLMQEGRARRNVRLVPADVSGVRAVLAALKRGEAAGFLPDQVPGEGEGEWADFFGRRAYTMTLAARLAERDGVLCFLAYAKRLPRGAGYAIVLRPLPALVAGESATRRVNRGLEALVRECPEQYLWGYNRYKTPKGARPR
ncbi:MAG TPA: lysophospholipid acyltransferase family protein [Burkholderiales bacterium]